MVKAPETQPIKPEIPYPEFKKTVEQWKHLADMQVFRNQIDLAIEANAEGLRFCGDRDPESRSQLEKQRDLLQERKTHQLQRSEAPGSLEEAAHHHNDAKARLDELREGKQKKNKKNRQKRKDKERKQKLEEAVSSLMAAINDVSVVLRHPDQVTVDGNGTE